MASGKKHFKRANQVMIVGSVIGFLTLPMPLASLLIVGLALGKYANPDVRDQEHIKNHAEYRFAKGFGVIPGALWSAYWWPLAAVIPHRNWKSHLPGPATLIALLYLFLPLLLVAWYNWYADTPLIDWMIGVLLTRHMYQIFLGWMIQDCFHLAQDKFQFYWKGGTK